MDTVQYYDKTLKLIQQAYLDSDLDLIPAYYATAIDDEEKLYRVRWEIINPEAEDESDTCDWNVYDVLKLA